MDVSKISATMNILEQSFGTFFFQEPLAKFTVFPKLPPELRQKIFRTALPTGSRGFRILKVHGTIFPPWEEVKRGQKISQKKKPKIEPESHVEFSLPRRHGLDNITMKELSLSLTCTESREIFLELNSYVLRTKGDGLIRFGKEDVIYIGKLSRFYYLNSKFNLVETNKQLRKLRGTPSRSLVWPL